MSSGQIVAIVVLVVLVAVVVAAVMVFRRRSPGQRRLEAAQHRREAEVRRASAERLEAEAAQRAERARAEQAQAAELAAMARHDREVAEREQAEALRLDPHTPVEVPARADQDAPAEQDGHRSRYVEPAPIVGGSVADLLRKRAEDRNGAAAPEQRTHSPADENPTVALPSARTGADARPDGADTRPGADARPGGVDAPSDRADAPVASPSPRPGVDSSDPVPAQRASGDTATAERTDDRAHNPVRAFADRILGRS